MSSSSCQIELQSALNLYWGVVGVSLGLTVLNLLVFGTFLRRRLESNPKQAAKIYFTTGSIKILLGILILTVFQPRCPSGCTCYGRLPSPFYGCIVLFIGTLWFIRGCRYLKTAREVPDGSENEQDTTAPTSEIEKTALQSTDDDDDGKERDTTAPSPEIV